MKYRHGSTKISGIQREEKTKNNLNFATDLMFKSHPSEDNEEHILESSHNLGEAGFSICDHPHTLQAFTTYPPMQFPF
jgi:hypothetical protein